MRSKNILTRREFLRRSAGIALTTLSAPALVPSTIFGKAGQVPPGERIVMGCIGVGGQGTYNARAFLNIPEVQVVAVCDVERESDLYYGETIAGREPARRLVNEFYAGNRGEVNYQGCQEYADFRELLDRDDIDAVTVCTPDHWHGLISVAAAEAGKDIYCEKPLTNTIAEGRAVVDAVRKYGRILQTGSHERSNDSVRYACELVRNGYIGKLRQIRVNMPNSDPHHDLIRQWNQPQPEMPIPAGFDYNMWLGHTLWEPYTEKRCHFWWRFILEYGGGEMTDRGAHIIDLAQLGNNTDHTGPVVLKARGSAPDDGLYNTFLSYEFECQYENGVTLLGSSQQPRGLKFEGTDGWIFIHIHGGRLEAEPASLLTTKIGPEEIHLGRSPEHHENFINAVKTRKQPVAPVEVGHHTATICHLLNIAMLTGTELQWDPENEQITNSPEANKMLARPMRSPWHL